MTFQPARPAEPPAAGQPPTETPEAVLDDVEQAVDSGRAKIADARSAALRAAESAEERDAINARFDQVEQQFGTAISRVEQAITSGNAQLLDGLRELVSAGTPGGQGDTDDDDDGDIVGIELIDDALEAATDGLDAAVAPLEAATDAAADAVEDVVPKRAHPLFRKLWGG